MKLPVDTDKWSGEGTFTQTLIDCLQQVEEVEFVRVEDAPASRSEADYNFISNEIFIVFATRASEEHVKRFGLLPATKRVTTKAMTIDGLEAALTASAEIGAPDYADDGMLQ